MAESFVNIEVKGAEAAQASLDAVARFMPLNSRTLGQVAELWKKAIKKRTELGKDAYDKDFVPYSKSYAKFRAKTERVTKTVNLMYQGRMLAAMTHSVDVTSQTMRLYFRAPAIEGLKAHGHSFGSKKTGLPQREFFALNKDDIDIASNFILSKYGP